jgi:hypothetical protein
MAASGLSRGSSAAARSRSVVESSSSFDAGGRSASARAAAVKTCQLSSRNARMAAIAAREWLSPASAPTARARTVGAGSPRYRRSIVNFQRALCCILSMTSTTWILRQEASSAGERAVPQVGVRSIRPIPRSHTRAAAQWTRSILCRTRAVYETVAPLASEDSSSSPIDWRIVGTVACCSSALRPARTG